MAAKKKKTTTPGPTLASVTQTLGDITLALQGLTQNVNSVGAVTVAANTQATAASTKLNFMPLVIVGGLAALYWWWKSR